MQLNQTLSWISRSSGRSQLITHLKQPITAKQLARASSLPSNSASYLLWELGTHQLLSCLNSTAQRSRIYWLTRLGQLSQRQLRKNQNLQPLIYDFPMVDWSLYGWVCFGHREAVILAMSEPMQPCQIKRKALIMNTTLRMSANNVRDIMRLFLAKGIIQPVRFRKKKHLRYELTPVGQQLRTLLQTACWNLPVKQAQLESVTKYQTR